MTFKNNNPQRDARYERIYQEAEQAARKAAELFRSKHGEPPIVGFAWVKIRGGCSFALWLKRAHPDVGRKGHHNGWDIWCPGGLQTQSMEILRIAATAFARTMALYAIQADVYSRED